MSAEDFLKIFETASFCLLPNSWNAEKHQIDITGSFIEGETASPDGDAGEISDFLDFFEFNFRILKRSC